MKRTIINHLLIFSFICFVSTGFAQYDQRCFIGQFEAGTTQAEIDALLSPYSLFVEDGPTTAFNNQFALICLDINLDIPDIFNVGNNGEVDINGVIITIAIIDDENDDIFDAIGLNYNIDLLPTPNGPPSIIPRHPLADCGLNTFSINTLSGESKRKVGLIDTGIKVFSGTVFEDFFDPYNLGWNIIEDTPDPADDNGHGTHMASSMILSTPPDLSSVLTLEAYKTHDFTGFADIWEIIEGIDKAMLSGVDFMNLSNSYQETYAHRFSNAPLKLAIEEAMDIAGILFVTAAGNNGMNNDDPLGLASYPASFKSDNILSVTAIDCNTNVPIWANVGASSVDIAAPGVGIWGINHNQEYVQLSGTSSATALTSRVVAMLATQQTVFDFEQIKCAIMGGATNIGVETLSKGYLNAAGAQVIFDSEVPCSTIPQVPVLSHSSNNVLNASIQNGRALSIESDKEQVANLRVYNLLGQILLSKEISILEGQNNYSFDLPDYPYMATYICHLQYGKQSKAIKFVK